MSKIETAAEAGRALIAEHLIQGGPGDADTLELAATLCNAAPALIAALKEARQWIAKGVADGAYNGCAAPLAPNRWLDRCGAILSRIDGAGDTLPDMPAPAPTGEEPYALKAARGYASNPEKWNPPSPEQMAEILTMIDAKGEN